MARERPHRASILCSMSCSVWLATLVRSELWQCGSRCSHGNIAANCFCSTLLPM
jgi:hypothetical protein